MEAAWLYQNEGVIAEYKNAQGELVRYDPSGQMQAYVQYLSLLPAMAREAEANARRFAALWPFVALAGIALGVLRPRRATWGAPSG